MEQEKKKLNPAVLGLAGFAMTTILLNLHNVGLIPLTAVIMGMGIAIGGLAQIIAGIFEMKEGNTFAGTAFVAYGFFWISLVIIWTSPYKADAISMGYYLLLWAIFTGFFFIGTFKHNTITKLVFGSLTLLFLLLAIADFSGVEAIKIAAGVVGIICGLFALYSGLAQLVNGEFNKNIFPL